jgi:hypothetical protein
MLSEFNQAAEEAFTSGTAPTMLQASASKGSRNNRHNFSAVLYTGFRIKVLSGTALSRDEMMLIGNVIISDIGLIRQLIVLGFDTLEIHDDSYSHGLRWKLIDYAKIGTTLISN